MPPAEQPKRISAPHPIFPDGAENAIHGKWITVWIEVDKEGRVSDATTYGPLEHRFWHKTRAGAPKMGRHSRNNGRDGYISVDELAIKEIPCVR